jgi:N-acetylneuraminate synthase
MDWAAWFDSAYRRDPALPRLVIAEGGINHNGSVDLACQIVEMSSRAGAHAVKFQKREPDICVPAEARDKLRQTPWGEMTYLEYKKRIELNTADYVVIDECARDCGIDWFVSAWDVKSQVSMRAFNSPINKVASAMLTHETLLREVASERKPTFISTGMSTLEQVDAAVTIFDQAGCPFILMHAVSAYPAPDGELNLRMIDTLSRRYGRPIGYSGHETSVSPSVVAAALGAVAIERHVTLDRSAWGTDQAASLEAPGLTSLVSILARMPAMLGDGVKSISDAERAVARNLRYWQ